MRLPPTVIADGPLRCVLCTLGATTLRMGTGADVREPSTPSPALGAGKPLALIAFLHCTGGSATREQLVDHLWADVPPESGRHTLRQTLWYLRKKLGAQLFETDGELVRLAVPIQSDRAHFLAALDAGDADLATQLYIGDFLPGFASPGAAAFEQWADIERRRLRSLYIGAAGRVVRARLETGRAREALTAARRTRDLAPASQAAWRMVLESLIAGGDFAGAKAEGERLGALLAADDLELEPATRQLLRTIESGRPPADAAPDARTLTAELVGRDEAFATLLRAYEDAARGTPIHVHVSAPAGLGKTRLIDGVAARLKGMRGQRARLVEVRTTPAERSLPFAFAGQLVTALVPLRGAAAVSPDTASTLVALAPAASTWLSASPDRSTGDEALRRRALALSELLAAVADDATIVVLIDDVHWMDPQSRTVVAALAERLQAVRVLLVTTGRGADAFADLTPNARRLPLAPLSVDDVTALVTSVATLPAEPWAELMPARLQTATGGSPLLIIETVQLAIERDLLAVRDGTWSCERPADLLALLGAGRALQQRVAALPATARDALLALAVAGDGMNDDSLKRVVGVETQEAMSLLETRGLVMRVGDSWRPAHDEIAAITIDSASARDRAAMHAALADWLEAQPPAPYAWNLARAVWHRGRSGDMSALEASAARFLDRSRANGDAISGEDLLREALGGDVPTDTLRALVARLPRRHRRPASPMRRWLAVGAVCAASGTAIALRARPATPEPDVTFELAVVDSTGVRQWVQGGVRLDRFADATAVEVQPYASPVQTTWLDSLNTVVRVGNRDQVIGDRLDERNREMAIDLVQVAAGGTMRPLISRPFDQASPVVSPMGDRFAFIDRGRWPSQAADIVVANIDGRGETALTNTPHEEKSVVWSPDGHRVAFLREFTDRPLAQICRADVAHRTERCTDVPREIVPQALRAWRADDALIVEAIARNTGLETLVLLSADGERVEMIDEHAQRYYVDPLGQLVLCECYLPGVDRPVVAVFTMGQPQRKRPLLLHGAFVERGEFRGVQWHSTLPAPATVRVRAPDSVVLGERVQLGSSARDGRGRDIPLVSRHWQLLDSSLATVDDEGLLIPRATGTVFIVLETSAGVADTARVRILPPSERIVLRERFTAPLEAAWFVLGWPKPFTARGRAGTELRINGDARLVSAIVSRESIDARRGVGVRVRFRAPITARVWQVLQLAIEQTPDSLALARMSTQPDAAVVDWRKSDVGSCFMALPRNEGLMQRDLVALRAGGQPVATRQAPPLFGDGAEHEAIIQLFADGRCALSLDGTLLGVSETPLRLTGPVRVVISGQSVGTTVSVQEVELWRGVRVGKLTDTVAP